MAMVEKDCERVELGPSGGLQFPQWNQLSPEVEAAMSSKSKPQNPQKPNPNPKVPSKIPIAHPPSSFFLSLKFFITCSHQQPPQSSSSSSFLFIFLSIFSPFIPLKPPPPHDVEFLLVFLVMKGRRLRGVVLGGEFDFLMDSFDGISVFGYDVNSSNMDDSDSSGLLEIYVHHARNIHNICIYENQDVYAKFSLTYNPDQTLSTRVINGGGKNPDFNENLRMKVTQPDSVLKCEIWMLSRARNYLEDQLLGFALVPLSQVVGKGKVTENYSLSSTDLFHSPAGTVQLSLSLDKSLPVDELNSISDLPVSSSISSEVVLLDRKISEVMLDSAEYSRIEFPDVNVVMENQQMVSEYFSLAGNDSCTRPRIATFLRLGASPPQPPYDFEMTANSTEEHQPGSISPNESSIQNSSFLSSTTTSLSDDRNSVDSAEKKIRFSGESSNYVNASVTTIEARNQVSGPCPDTPTSRKSGRAAEDKESKFSNNKDKISIKKEGSIPSVKFGQLFSAPLGNINVDAEQSAMQQQIVDMYMKSMHQFTESLAKMKLPMDLDKPEHEHRGVVLQTHDPKPEINQKKKDGSRVFYGSRAFF